MPFVQTHRLQIAAVIGYAAAFCDPLNQRLTRLLFRVLHREIGVDNQIKIIRIARRSQAFRQYVVDSHVKLIAGQLLAQAFRARCVALDKKVSLYLRGRRCKACVL